MKTMHLLIGLAFLIVAVIVVAQEGPGIAFWSLLILSNIWFSSDE